jgi:hypothetical protein
MIRILLPALIVLFAGVANADDKEVSQLPVTATLVGKARTFVLDRGGMSAEAYAALLKEGEKTGKLPPPPDVGLTLQLKNTSDKDVQVWISGNPVVLELELKGPGAVSLKPRMAFPSIYILPKPVTIEPGKTHDIPVKALKYGFRGVAQSAYWTEPGEYTLTASYKTAISPAPKDSKLAKDGFGMVTLTSKAIKLNVESK